MSHFHQFKFQNFPKIIHLYGFDSVLDIYKNSYTNLIYKYKLFI